MPRMSNRPPLITRFADDFSGRRALYRRGARHRRDRATRTGRRGGGAASLLAWAALVVLSGPLAATFAALGARYPDAGGVSTYARRAFGPKAAAIVGWCFYFAVPAGAPAAAMFGGAYVAAVTGGGHTTVIVTAAALIATVSAANAFGVTVSGRMQLVLSALLVTLLLAAVLASAPHARTANLHPFAPHGWLAVGQVLPRCSCGVSPAGKRSRISRPNSAGPRTTCRARRESRSWWSVFCICRLLPRA